MKKKELDEKIQKATADRDVIKRAIDKMREREEKIKKIEERLKWVNSTHKKKDQLSAEQIQWYIDRIRVVEEERPGDILDAGRRRGGK